MTELTPERIEELRRFVQWNIDGIGQKTVIEPKVTSWLELRVLLDTYTAYQQAPILYQVKYLDGPQGTWLFARRDDAVKQLGNNDGEIVQVRLLREPAP